MKILLTLFIFLLSACATDTAYYPVLQKDSFLNTSDNKPVKNMTLARGMSYQKDICAGQFFFSSNARKETDQKLARQVANLCPNENYLLEANIKKTWWTLLLYSRSCVEFKAYCPRNTQ